MKPRNDRIIVVGLDVGIAKNWMLSTAPDGLLNGRGHREVHVSDPEGNEREMRGGLGGKTTENRRRRGGLGGKTTENRTG
jgi:hypothetical protein